MVTGTIILFIIVSVFIGLKLANIEASTENIEICDNRIDDNGDGKIDGCWDPGSNYQPTGTIYYVSTNGNDDNTGSVDKPFKTFTKAASLAQHHPENNTSDAIYIKSGVYDETLTLQHPGTPDRPIVVRGIGATRPIIRVGGGNVGHIEPKSNTIIDNLQTDGIQTVTDAGHGLGGYGVFMSNVENILIDNGVFQQHEKGIRAEYGDRLIVRNSLIKNCEWGTYIGTDNENGFSPEFTNTLWENVEAADSAWDYWNTDGFLIEGYSAYHVFRNCKAHGWNDGGFDLKPHVLVENCQAYDNNWQQPEGVANPKYTSGIGIKIWRDGIVRNSIAFNNRISNYLFGGYRPNWQLINSISYNGNVSFEKRADSDPNLSAQTIKLSHNIFVNSTFNDEIGNAFQNADNNLFFGSTPPTIKGSNPKEFDPKFVNASSKNFHLTQDSPAIDSGSTILTSFMSKFDFEGRDRKSGQAVDIGPYEYGSTNSIQSPEPSISVVPSPITSITPIPSPTTTSSTITTQAEDPIFASTNPKFVYGGNTLQFKISARDSSGGTMRYAAIDIPDGATLIRNTFRWTPSKDISGSYTAKFRATSSSGRSAEKEVSIKVLRRMPYSETRTLNVENSPDKADVSFQICRRSSYSDTYKEVITFSDGSPYLEITEEGRSACTNFYSHHYNSGAYLMTAYLCPKDDTEQRYCFPTAAKLIKR
ncbi:MAG: choice-of-anchor Q domain-containing protein [Bacteroidales bacterium]|nr:choice-of-anchor Q domain-containing protein [Bacteroidales bacterium]